MYDVIDHSLNKVRLEILGMFLMVRKVNKPEYSILYFQGGEGRPVFNLPAERNAQELFSISFH